MIRVKYIGFRSRILNGVHIFRDEVRLVSERQARTLQNDPFFVVLDTLPEQPSAILKIQVVDDEPLQAQPKVAPEPGKDNPAPTLPAKVRKPRGKKK